MIRLRDGTLSLTDAEKVRLRQQLELINGQQQQLALQKSEAQLQADMQKDREQIAADIGAGAAFARIILSRKRKP